MFIFRLILVGWLLVLYVLVRFRIGLFGISFMFVKKDMVVFVW